MRPSVALGVIARKCGSLRLVLAGPAGCLRSRWRSGPRKWRHDAVSRVRGRKHRAPVGALRRGAVKLVFSMGSWQEAPRTCRCIKTEGVNRRSCRLLHGRKHRAPVGALRHVK